MLTLRTPSFHVGAGRAFTETIQPLTLIVAPRHRRSAPSSDHQLPPCVPLWRTGSVSPREPGSSHRPLVVVMRMTNDRTRRWRNDPKRLPSCQLLRELALIQRGIPAVWTGHLAASDRATHHASSVTIRRSACAPFRYVRRFHPASYTELANACAPGRSARRSPPGLEASHRRPRQRFRRFAPD